MGAEVLASVVIASLVKAGADVTGSVVSSRATSNAARTQADAQREAARIQQEASDKAIAAEKEQINADRQRQAALDASRAPYVQTGNQSLAALSKQLGLPAFNPTAVPPMTPPQGNYAQPPQGQPRGINTSAPAYQTQPQPAQAMSLADFNAGSRTAPEGDTPDMVMLVAPTGEKQAVPRSQVAHYISRGARYVA